MRVIMVFVAVVSLAWVALAAGPAASGPAASAPAKLVHPFTIGPETTIVDGPVLADGTIDYVAVVNERWGKGVTLQNNAAVDYLRAVGPEGLSPEYRAEVLAAMGIAELPADGPYLVPANKFFAGTPDETESAQRLDRDMQTAMKTVVKSKDCPELAKWIAANRAPLGRFTVMAGKTQYFIPFGQPKDKNSILAWDLVGRLGRMRELARGLTARAMLQAGDGNADAAVPDLLALQRLSRLMANKAPNLICALVAIAMERQSTEAMAALAVSDALDDKQAKALAAGLAELGHLPPLLTAMEGERFYGLYVNMCIARIGLEAVTRQMGEMAKFFESPRPVPKLPPIRLDLDEVMRFENQLYQRVVACLKLGSFAKAAEAMAKLQQEFPSPLGDRDALSLLSIHALAALAKTADANDPKAFARAVVLAGWNGVTEFRGWLQLPEEARQQMDLVIVGLALRRYQIAKRKCPAKLEELVPTFMEAVPKDRFTGSPLVYRPAEKDYVLYSIGPNGKDDGGKTRIDDGDDVVIRRP